MRIRSLAALILAGGVVAGVAAQQPKRIVLIAGRASHAAGEHEFKAGSMLLQKALSGVPTVKVDVFTNGWPTKMVDGQAVDDNGPLEQADAIFIYADGGSGHPMLRGDRRKVIEDRAAKGVGLGFGHYGVEVPAGEPGALMQRLIGGYYETNWSVNPMWSPEYKNFPTHPITRGVGPFSNHDEWYFNMRWTTDAALKSKVTPLLVATPSDAVRAGPYVSPKGPYDHISAAKGQAETMMWAMERPDGGRSFGFTGSHTHTHWGDVNQRRIVLNALLWMAKVNVPPGGVVDAITAADLTANLDQKPPRKQ